MLQGSKVRLWAVEKQELLNNYIWGNDPELIRLAGMNPFPKSFAEIDKWYEQVVSNTAGRVFAAKTGDGEYIGNVEISAIDWRIGKAEVGIFIGDHRFRGRGFGEDAMRTLLRFAFDEMRLHRLSTRVLEYNERALRLFERCGFRREGRERDGHYLGGRHWDVIHLGLLEKEHRRSIPSVMNEEFLPEAGKGTQPALIRKGQSARPTRRAPR
jgi:RimJ/RimL family protein N-acetyltransferase